MKKPKSKPKRGTRELPPGATATVIDFVLHAGEMFSDTLNIATGKFVGLITPQNWHPAHITFQVSMDGVDWFDLLDADGQEVGLNTTAIPQRAMIDISDRVLFNNVLIRIRSGRSNEDITQPEDCTFSAVIAP